MSITELELDGDELPADQVLEGGPRVASRALWTSPDGSIETGVWEITPGVSSDVEATETFVVLAGEATVAIDGGPTLELRPGIVGSFAGGERTIWRVRTTLRKLYTVAS